jgi:glycosyltransferase involved in cell wall biosynthesis
VSFRKGVHLLVRAFAELALPGAELWLIGSPTPEIKPLLHRYRDYPIFLKGPFPQAILPDYYAQGSVFCLATYEEGLAMVIPQALGSGLPVIASANSGAQDVVEDGKTGFIVSTGNLDALKDKLRLMYENAEMLKEMTARVRSSPPADLSWSRYGEAMTNGYTRILFG